MFIYLLTEQVAGRVFSTLCAANDIYITTFLFFFVVFLFLVWLVVFLVVFWACALNSSCMGEINRNSADINRIKTVMVLTAVRWEISYRS